MKLELEDGTVVHQPGERDLEKAVESLVCQENNFAILSQNEMTYIQVANYSDAGFRLEYQAGTTEEHFCVPQPVPRDEVVTALKNYASGNQAWQEAHDWQHDTAGLARGSGCMGVLLGIVALLIGAASLHVVAGLVG